jgi:hypothetical protein
MYIYLLNLCDLTRVNSILLTFVVKTPIMCQTGVKTEVPLLGYIMLSYLVKPKQLKKPSVESQFWTITIQGILSQFGFIVHDQCQSR